MSALIPVFAENRYKCLRKCAFGKHAPQQIGQFERHEESIGCHTCTEHARDQHVAREG